MSEPESEEDRLCARYAQAVTMIHRLQQAAALMGDEEAMWLLGLTTQGLFKEWKQGLHELGVETT
jgi:hypothetical protein